MTHTHTYIYIYIHTHTHAPLSPRLYQRRAVGVRTMKRRFFWVLLLVMVVVEGEESFSR